MIFYLFADLHLEETFQSKDIDVLFSRSLEPWRKIRGIDIALIYMFIPGHNALLYEYLKDFIDLHIFWILVFDIFICYCTDDIYLILILFLAFNALFCLIFVCLVLPTRLYSSIFDMFVYIYIPYIYPFIFLFSLNSGCRLREWLEVYDCIGLRSYRQGGTTISCHSLRRTQRSYTTPLAQPPFDRFYAMPRQLYAWWVVFTIPLYLHRTLGQVYFRYLR